MSWLDDHPEITTICTATADLNGVARGKWMPRISVEKAMTGGARMPLSVLNVDILGQDIEGSPLVFETGDQDGTLMPTERGVLPMPWLSSPTALIPMWMETEGGEPYEGDPRQVLSMVLDRFAAKGWQVIAATELEFFLIDDKGGSPLSGRLGMGDEILSLQALEVFEPFFADLYEGADKMGIPADTASSEAGVGQYEITLKEGPAMKAADDTWLLKMLIKGLARKHGLAASFMAKPIAGESGNGLHLHASVLDGDGQNIFDNNGPEGTELLQGAVAGCLEAMADSTLIFAPHGNSYDRLTPGAHAPTSASWGYDNRTVAVRIPGGSPRARRFEHRVAGGDTNPYLVIAAILGAAFRGMEDGLTPPAPITGNAYQVDGPGLAKSWDAAIDAVKSSTLLPRFLPKRFLQNLAMTKAQEVRIWNGLCPEKRLELYLERV